MKNVWKDQNKTEKTRTIRCIAFERVTFVWQQKLAVDKFVWAESFHNYSTQES